MNRDEIPDGIPSDYMGEASGQTPIQVGSNVENGVVVIKVGSEKMVALPVLVAMQLAQSLNAHAIRCLIGPDQGPEESPPGPKIIT